jgi:hypothetical protein
MVDLQTQVQPKPASSVTSPGTSCLQGPRFGKWIAEIQEVPSPPPLSPEEREPLAAA